MVPRDCEAHRPLATLHPHWKRSSRGIQRYLPARPAYPASAGRGLVLWSDVLESVLPDCLRWAVYGGALTAAGGLVFYGTMEGWLKAVDQKTGQELWRFKTRRASSPTR